MTIPPNSTELSYDPASTLGFRLLTTRNRDLNMFVHQCTQKYLYTNVHSSITNNSQREKQLKCSLTDKGIYVQWNIIQP